MSNAVLKMKPLAKYIILSVSILFISIGMMREEHFVVLKKAVNICLECIGVG